MPGHLLERAYMARSFLPLTLSTGLYSGRKVDDNRQSDE
jgi:hypothetical protein